MFDVRRRKLIERAVNLTLQMDLAPTPLKNAMVAEIQFIKDELGVRKLSDIATLKLTEDCYRTFEVLVK